MEAQIPDRQLQQGWTAISEMLAGQQRDTAPALNLATAHIRKARMTDAAASKLSCKLPGGRLPPQRPTLLDSRWQGATQDYAYSDLATAPIVSVERPHLRSHKSSHKFDQHMSSFRDS